MTNLPNSEQSGNLDNLAVTRAEFRSEIGILLEYMAQALGSVTGTYTTQVVDPLNPELQGTPTLEIGADPLTDDRSLRIPTTQWVKNSGRYVGTTAPTSPELGMLWIDTNTNPFTIRAYDGAAWDIVSGVASGTRMLFQQSAAPTGWTKDTVNDNTALRVTAGAVSTGGTLDFTNVFTTGVPVTGTVGGTALTVAEMPAHSHGVSDAGHSHGVSDPGHGHAYTAASNYSQAGGSGKIIAQGVVTGTAGAATGVSINGALTGITVQANGSGNTHTHSFTGAGMDLSVKYVDVIVAEKN